MNYQFTTGSNSFIFSRKPTKTECEWLAAGYGDASESYKLKACPDSYASDDAILARIRESVNYARKS